MIEACANTSSRLGFSSGPNVQKCLTATTIITHSESAIQTGLGPTWHIKTTYFSKSLDLVCKREVGWCTNYHRALHKWSNAMTWTNLWFDILHCNSNFDPFLTFRIVKKENEVLRDFPFLTLFNLTSCVLDSLMEIYIYFICSPRLTGSQCRVLKKSQLALAQAHSWPWSKSRHHIQHIQHTDLARICPWTCAIEEDIFIYLFFLNGEQSV